MNTAIDPDMRILLQDGFTRYGRERYTFERRHAALSSADAHCADAWASYAELGWLALRLPEAFGGLDADAQIIGTLMETVGRHLLLEPLLASTVLGTGALRYAPALQETLAPVLADGSCRLAFAHQGETMTARDGRLSGTRVGVLHGDVADHVVVVAGVPRALYLVDVTAAGIGRRSSRLVDGRGAANFHFEDAPAEPLGAPEDCERLLDESTVALCAEASGSAAQLIDVTAAYLKMRKQFGRALAWYQALQHRLSEMVLLLEEIRALTQAAQHALDAFGPPRARIVSGAAAYVIDAARSIGNEAVQLHGGMGVTEELEVSHHFRRLMVIAALLGGRDAQLERFASNPASPTTAECPA